MKKIILILLLISFSELWAQDPVFTQFYAAPTILNPAFAGSRNSTRFSLGYRNQWLGVKSDFNSFYASGDAYIGSINSGVGANIINQKEARTNYSYTQLNLMYSRHLKLDENWSLFPGISFGYALRQFNFNGLLFEDQIDLGSGSTNPTQDEFAERGNIHIFDISAGFVLYHTNAWFGLSAKHLNKPNISFVEEQELTLNMFISVHGGYRFTLADKSEFDQNPYGTYLFLTMNYMNQGPYNRLDLGAEFEISNFFVGMLSSISTGQQLETSDLLLSVNPLMGMQIKQFKIGLSYDFPLSSIGNNAGTAEITLQYDLGNSYSRKRMWQIKN